MKTYPEFLELKTSEKIAETLRAIGNSVRLRLVDLLAGGEKCVGEMTDALDARQPIVSQQLKILRMAGLVKTRKTNGRIYYSLNNPHLIDLMFCLRKCETPGNSPTPRKPKR